MLPGEQGGYEEAGDLLICRRTTTIRGPILGVDEHLEACTVSCCRLSSVKPNISSAHRSRNARDGCRRGFSSVSGPNARFAVYLQL